MTKSLKKSKRPAGKQASNNMSSLNSTTLTVGSLCEASAIVAGSAHKLYRPIAPSATGRPSDEREALTCEAAGSWRGSGGSGEMSSAEPAELS